MYDEWSSFHKSLDCKFCMIMTHSIFYFYFYDYKYPQQWPYRELAFMISESKENVHDFFHSRHIFSMLGPCFCTRCLCSCYYSSHSLMNLTFCHVVSSFVFRSLQSLKHNLTIGILLYAAYHMNSTVFILSPFYTLSYWRCSYML